MLGLNVLTATGSLADELGLFPTEREESNEGAAAEETTDVIEDFEINPKKADGSDQPAVTAFQDAVREAQQEAETRLAAVVGQARQAAAELALARQQHEAEVFQIRDQYSAEAQAEIDKVRQELAEQHAVEVTRLREELEQQHAADLERARNVAIESLRALTELAHV